MPFCLSRAVEMREGWGCDRADKATLYFCPRRHTARARRTIYEADLSHDSY